MSGILTFFRSLLSRTGLVPLRARFLVILAVVAAGPAWADPNGAWNSGVAGNYPTARDACHAQWIWAGYGNNRSRFIDALPSDVWWIKRCSWTQFQYLCPEET